MPKVVTANTLTTGHVVFLAEGGAWVESIGQARLFEDAEAAERGLASAQADAEKAIVVEPFVADVADGQDGRLKMHLRDTIRAYGPTVDYHRNGAASPSGGA